MVKTREKNGLEIMLSRRILKGLIFEVVDRVMPHVMGVILLGEFLVIVSIFWLGKNSGVREVCSGEFEVLYLC